ncbi:molybdenum cofactor synthesis protein cinnamon [Leptopilina boulardi]|uniref:molybdenum cofactor synthesis protein cinnamon n=1 Tax=Leptopilina boulardi TaxID=63433 RepID=UPI0021F57BD6|nr:molybdenum cofactor synthesis protein cinnamon [Leptopilina boulardi]
MTLIQFAILTVSDSCSVDQSKDISGPTLVRLVTNAESKTGQILKGHVSYKAIVPDDKQKIENILKTWTSLPNVNVILTSGGTGFSDRDVTPEATKNVIEKETPGISFAMLNASLKVTQMAMLTRLTSGIRNKTLIINLPGSPKAVTECLEAIAIAIPHAVDLILNNNSEITHVHKMIQTTQQHTCVHKTEILYSQIEERRIRQSPYPMISVESAFKLIEENVTMGEIEIISAWNAFGRILRENVFSVVNLPPFRASVKDGYAVLDTDGKGLRKVIGSSDAGDAPNLLHLNSGTCVWVNTGAPVPNNATAVVQVEDTIVKEYNSNGKEIEIEILIQPTAGQDIRSVGSDLQEGALVLNANTKICEVEIGLLISCGCLHVKVSKLPMIGVLSTGNELQSMGESLKSGHIYDSNKITLMSMLKNFTCVPIDFGIVVDNKTEIIHALQRALNEVDILVTSGSVSMGDKDFLKPVLEQNFHAVVHFGRLNMKPGKPMTFATCNFHNKKKFIVCLPGNPVSAVVTAYLFLQPIINRLNGNNSKPIIISSKITFSHQLDVRPEYLRVILQWNDSDPYPQAYNTGNQTSSRLLNCKSANALLLLPGKTEEIMLIKKGDLVKAMLLNINQCILE